MNEDHMTDKLIEMPFLRNIGLLMTYKCQVTCPHCIIEAGPHRKEEMSIGDASNWIEQISNYRDGYIKVLALTGGEPFYNLENLSEISQFAAARGLFVSVVTNAFWANTKNQAVKTLKHLNAIKMLSISTDVYHQESIPFERVENAIAAAREIDIPFTVAVCTENEGDPAYQRILCTLERIVEKDVIQTAITFVAGRAFRKTDRLQYQMSKNPPISACGAGSSPIIFPDGRVVACVGPIVDLRTPHPLLLGSLRKNCLKEILDGAESNSILHTIRIWGPKKIISLIENAGLDKHLPDEYVKDSICNACYCLMSNEEIVNFLNQLADDVEFTRKVAYARIYYLKETTMAEINGLIETYGSKMG